MKTLKQFIKEVYQYKKGQWDDDDVTDIVRTTAQWLAYKRVEKFAEYNKSWNLKADQLGGQINLIEEFLEELKNES
jgi:hypothetical protein